MNYLTPQQVCTTYEIKRDKLYKMTSQCRIPFLKIGNELRFNVEEIERAFRGNGSNKKILV